MRITFKNEETFLLALCRGLWDKESVIETLEMIHKEMTRQSLDIVLIDWRQVRRPKSEFYYYLAGEKIGEIYSGQRTKIAILFADEKGGDFLETTARNRGVIINACCSDKEARKWLQELQSIPDEPTPVKLADYEIPDWKDKYLTGIPEIDFQHQYFLELIRSFYSRFNEGLSEEIVNNYLREMILYARFHFCSEENIMSLHQYPELSDHKELHDNLIAELEIIVDSLDAHAVRMSTLITFLVDWFLNHTVEEDQKFAIYQREIV